MWWRVDKRAVNVEGGRERKTEGFGFVGPVTRVNVERESERGPSGSWR